MFNAELIVLSAWRKSPGCHPDALRMVSDKKVNPVALVMMDKLPAKSGGATTGSNYGRITLIQVAQRIVQTLA